MSGPDGEEAANKTGTVGVDDDKSGKGAGDEDDLEKQLEETPSETEAQKPGAVGAGEAIDYDDQEYLNSLLGIVEDQALEQASETPIDDNGNVVVEPEKEKSTAVGGADVVMDGVSSADVAVGGVSSADVVVSRADVAVSGADVAVSGADVTVSGADVTVSGADATVDSMSVAKGDGYKTADETGIEMEVSGKDDPEVLDLGILRRSEEEDWDEVAEARVKAAGGATATLRTEFDQSRIVPRSYFFASERMYWMGQTFQGELVKIIDFPQPKWVVGREMALRYRQWLRITEWKELGITPAEDRGLLEAAVHKMIEAFPQKVESLAGARNSLRHWVDMEVNQWRQQRRRQDQVNIELKEKQKAAEALQRRLHSRSAKLSSAPLGGAEGAMGSKVAFTPKKTSVPYAVRDLEPIEDEIVSLDDLLGSHRSELVVLKKNRLFGDAVKGTAFKWPARHSDPMSVAPCCKRCGEDAHQETGTECGFEMAKQKDKRRGALPKDVDPKGLEDNIYVAMHRAADGASVAEKTERCTYPLCGDKDTHFLRACPTLHARCGNCLYRGHKADTLVEEMSVCPKKSVEERHESYCSVALLGITFERFAGDGRYTSKRFEFPAAGFFPCIGAQAEVLTGQLGYEAMLRLGGSEIAEYLEGCRAAANKVLGADLVAEVVGDKYRHSREEEKKLYDDYVKEFVVAYGGAKQRLERKAVLRGEQIDILRRIQRQTHDKKVLETASGWLEKCREEIWGLVRQYVVLTGSMARVVAGAEPVDEKKALSFLSKQVVQVYTGKKEEKAEHTLSRVTASTASAGASGVSTVPSMASVVATSRPNFVRKTITAPSAAPRSAPMGEPAAKRARLVLRRTDSLARTNLGQSGRKKKLQLDRYLT